MEALARGEQWPGPSARKAARAAAGEAEPAAGGLGDALDGLRFRARGLEAEIGAVRGSLGAAAPRKRALLARSVLAVSCTCRLVYAGL
jgi:hypothetical protein